MPKWKKVLYASIVPEVQRAYDVYVEKFAAANDSAKTLMATAERVWTDDNPDGINGEYCAFNATNGKLSWVMAKKKNKKTGKSYKNDGEPVPSARQNNKPQTDSENATGHATPGLNGGEKDKDIMSGPHMPAAVETTTTPAITAPRRGLLSRRR